MRLSTEVRLAIIRDVAAALNAAHATGISHRRVSPGSIYLDLHQDDLHKVVAKVGDWDRAHLGDRRVLSGASSLLLQDLEDLRFVAPEVKENNVEDWVAADLWSLARVIEWIWEKFGTSTEPLPPRLEGLVIRLGNPDPYERTASAIDVFETACAFLTDTPTDRHDTEVVELLEGNLIGNDRYLIHKVLSTSGLTSTVLDVEDTLLQQHFALKVFKGAFGKNRAFLLNEFAVLNSVHNLDAVVVVHDGVELSEGHIALKMELLKGKTLRSYIDTEGPLDLETALELFDKLLEALSTLHQRDPGPISHRDIKPNNIIYEKESGRGLVFIDFGFSEGPGGPILGGGSRAYRPAEAEPDAPGSSLDLFALAVTLHEALTGLHPWGFGDCEGPILMDANLPRELQELFSDAIGKDAGRRFDSADEFRRALNSIRRNLGHIEAVAEPATDPALPDRLPGEEVLCLGDKVFVHLFPDRERRIEAATLSGAPDVEATVHRARIRAEPAIMLDVELCQADNGETWIKAVDAYRSPNRIQRLLRGLRTGIHPVPGDEGDMFMELRQAQIIDDPDWPEARTVTKELLDSAAEVDVEELLKSLGGTRVASRKAAWGDKSRRRKILCVVFGSENAVVPIVAYALTRVAPLVDEPSTSP